MRVELKSVLECFSGNGGGVASSKTIVSRLSMEPKGEFCGDLGYYVGDLPSGTGSVSVEGGREKRSERSGRFGVSCSVSSIRP